MEGNYKVILCERGVVAPHTHRSTSRFLLDLQVVPAAQEITHLPVVVDPISCNILETLGIFNVTCFNRLRCRWRDVRSHPKPEMAAVDPLQPISYLEFEKLFSKMGKLAASLDRLVGK